MQVTRNARTIQDYRLPAYTDCVQENNTSCTVPTPAATYVYYLVHGPCHSRQTTYSRTADGAKRGAHFRRVLSAAHVYAPSKTQHVDTYLTFSKSRSRRCNEHLESISPDRLSSSLPSPVSPSSAILCCADTGTLLRWDYPHF